MRRAVAWVFISILAVGCASAPTVSQPPTNDGSGPERPSTPKRITAVMMSDPTSLNNDVNRATAAFVIAGGPELQLLVSAGLGVEDDHGSIQPQLAETIPSLENGLWNVFPDGRMETSWQIRPGAQWHDGTPFTSADLVFTFDLVQDKDLEVFRNVAFETIERVEAADARTVVATWRQSYIYAAQLFTPTLAVPFPKHILEREYLENKRNVLFHPYWAQEFVGTGPYKLREFVRSSHMYLDANSAYVLGRPQVDEIEVRLIPDPNALTANILSNVVELTIGRNLALEQALQVRDQWREGNVVIAPASFIVIYPQFFNPSPAIVSNVRFRQALTFGMDRQEMVDSLQGGLTSVAHSFLALDEPEYREVEGSIVRYAYDPARAAQMIEALGYTKGPDGGFRDATNARLAIELRSLTGIDINQKAQLSAADYWQRLGLAVEQVIVPRARAQDREYIATFPGFQVNRQGSTVSFLTNRRSSSAPIAETNFVGQNYARYMDPAFDGLIDRFFVTIPWQDRMQVLRQVIHQMTDEVHAMGLFFDGTPTLMAKRIERVTPRQQGWNAHEWDAR